jgi:hypothetical protein
MAGLAAAAGTAADVNEVVSRSVANNQNDWKAAPQFDFTERDVIVKGGAEAVRTYRVTMIDGSPYSERIAEDGKELSASEKEREQKKMERERQKRSGESAGARSRRIAEYQKGRQQDHLLMQEMIRGFEFKLAGTETANGRQCYRVEATPNPDYRPQSREAEVLKGMKGTLWIDVNEYQWVRVEAGVFKPVTFGLFIAHVEPGTEFVLEESPVEGGIWEPSYFENRVNAHILVWPHKTLDQETYSNYTRRVERAEK